MDKRAKALHDQALELKPEGARHDANLCPFCLDTASAESGTPSGSDRPAEAASTDTTATTASEGGTTTPMDTISKETHEALLAKAVADATADKASEIQTLTAALERATTDKASAETKVAELTADNARLNGDLDKAQVEKKTVEDELASLRTDIAAKEEAAHKADLASKRAEEVKALGLFSDDYVTEKASRWADVTDVDWAERLDEWKATAAAKAAATGSTTTDTASAMSGSNESTTSTKPSARRAVLGLS